mmetsp:Transcript_20966/g.42755  ORF Transcript_20966/g.42755 Transcript_20966/m.42755 type:complete len:200 (-) Transcript_20966:1384-1983(-)
MKKHLKIVLVGPPRSGKTEFANLFDSKALTAKEHQQGQRSDHHGCILRIVETSTIDGTCVELWDVGSGSGKSEDFETRHKEQQRFWKAIMQGINADGKPCNARVDGVIISMNANEGSQSQQEVSVLYDKFVKQSNVPDKCCRVLCRGSNNVDSRVGRSIPKQMKGCRVHDVTDLMDKDEAKKLMEEFVADICSISMMRR